MNLYRPSYNEVHQSSLKNSPKSSPKDVNQTQQKILDMIQENPKITQNAMAEKLNITSSAVKKSMKEIVNVGILVRIGTNKGGYWEVGYK